MKRAHALLQSALEDEFIAEPRIKVSVKSRFMWTQMLMLKHRVQVACSESPDMDTDASRSISYVYEALKQIIVLLRLPCPGISKVRFLITKMFFFTPLDQEK